VGDKTAIEWTDATWNPIIGCSRVGPGCDHCYAIGVVRREMSPQHVGLTVKRRGEPTDWTGEVRPWAPMLDQPLRWRRPRRIFVNSLSDLFHPDLPDDEIAKVFAVMGLAPQHTFQVLTKRPQRMAALLSSPAFTGAAGRAALAMSQTIPPQHGVWPLPNVWLGTSIESDRYTFRADHLRATPAAVRWISAEPLLGPLPSLDLTGIDWLVVGGESGPGARPMHPDWARDLRDACWSTGKGTCPTCGGSGSVPVPGGGAACDACYHESYGGTGQAPVAFLFKQWGDWAPAPWKPRRESGEEHHAWRERANATGATHSIAPWPGSFQELGHRPASLERSPGDHHPHQGLRRFGKKAAGRKLDGRTWDQYPEVATTT